MRDGKEIGKQVYGSRRRHGSNVMSFRCPDRYQDVIGMAKEHIAKTMPLHFRDAKEVPDAFVIKCGLESLIDLFNLDANEISKL